MTTMTEMPGRTFRILGLVIDTVTGRGMPGLRVEAWDKDLLFDDKLGSATTDAQGKFQITFHESDFQGLISFGEEKPDLYFKVFQNEILIKSTLDSVLWNVPAGETPVTITVNVADSSEQAKGFYVQGKVASRVSAGVGGLRVVIVDKGVGGDVQLAETSTNEVGAYQATFSDSAVQRRGKAQPDLQARVFRDDRFLGASEVRYNASHSEQLYVVLTEEASSTLASEHETLTSALFTHFTGKLGDLKETDDQQDITYLANKTGWDARAVALAALADQFSTRTADASGARAIPQEFFYALFRAGLPANEDTLYHTDAKTMETVWKQAAAQGVIPKGSADQIPTMVERFQVLNAQNLLTAPAFAGVSSLKEMLTFSKLADAQQARFAQLYTAHRGDMPTFWKAVQEDQAFGATPDERAKTVTRLQLDGKLGFLTINNALLMEKVHAIAGEKGLSDPLELAQTGYYRAEAWSQLLTDDVTIPKEIPGDTKTQRANYANYLAAQVRLGYPTASVARMIKSGELPLTGAEPGISDNVHAFLIEHQHKDKDKFEIGVEPVERYLKRNNIEVTPEREKIVAQIKRVQRVYQLTPSDEAMTGLMKRGVDAAYHVVRYDKDTFVQSFAADLGGADQAALTYERSVQVHNTVLNIALSYLNARTAPGLGIHGSSSVLLDPTPAHAADVIAYPTLERLFGSMDFCACDHCRSILSPAAYLVDLLQFLGSDDEVWSDFLTKWKSPEGGHERAPYPFPNQKVWNEFQSNWNTQHPGQPLPNTEISPFNVMMSRRPDIQHLPLTCENTNTALPYIDVVNETLEYYIANGLTLEKKTLDEYHGHDTNGVASEDLLASPQFVMDTAYAALRSQRFPAPLPFHQPLESLRRYFHKFDVPLPSAMERLRKTDDLERGANLYGWRDIWMEEISLSRDEYEILTDTNAVTLWRMYGFPNGTADADVIAVLSNAKQFARRVDITYEELISVLRTRFINPNSDLIPKLERLGVNFAMLAELKTKNDAPTDAKFDALLAKLAVPPDPSVYGGDPHAPKNDYTPIRAWVKNNDNYTRIMSLIALAIPATTWTASKAYATGDCVLPTTPQSESTLYYECTTPGTSAASKPNWPATPGDTKNDGTVVWTCRDASSCLSFDNLAFRYTDPAKLNQNIGAAEFIRLLRFIRLWKKLGWTIEQTDSAITALYPAHPLGNTETKKLDNGFLTMLPRLGIVSRVIKALNITVKRDLLPLLACFAPIGTHDGAEWFIDKDQSRRLRPVQSFYRQLFLNPALLEQDTVFADNGYGEFLTDATKKIADHTEALRSAFNLTSQELAQIAEALNFIISLEVPYTHAQSMLEQAILEAAPGIGYDDLSHQLSYPGTLSTTARDALKAVAGVSQQFKDAVDALFAANPTLTPLILPNISTIFRRGWLARKLKLSVREFLLLIQLTGLDPFSAPEPTGPALLQLVELIQSMKERSLKSAVALYLIWNQDLSGKSAPPSDQVSAFARILRVSLAAVENEFSIMDDPDGSIAQIRMAMVYGNDAANLFFSFLNNTFVSEVTYERGTIVLVTTVSYTHHQATLEQAILDATSNQIAYDDTTKKLSFNGSMTDAVLNALKKIAGVTNEFKNAVDTLYAENQKAVQANLEQPIVDVAPGRISYDDFQKKLSFRGVLTDEILNTLKAVQINGAPLSQDFTDALTALYQENQKIVAPFFTRYPELQSPYDAYVSDTTHATTEKRTNLLKAILPELIQRRKRQQALQAVSAVANTDLAFTQTFLDAPAAPFPLHAAGNDVDQPALNDLLALESPGLSVQFFANDTATGTTIPSLDIGSKLDYAPLVGGVGNPLPANPTPGAAISGVWRGYLEAPESGFFNLRIEADAGTTVALLMDGQPVTLVQNATLWENSDSIQLRAGTFYSIKLTVEKVRNIVRVECEWTPKGQGRAVIPPRYLYPATPFEAFKEAYVRFLKAASLATSLGLTANELAYLATHSDYHVNNDGWLNSLTVSGNPDSATVNALLKPFEALLDFARIKADISSIDESLLTAMRDLAAATQNADSLLFKITRWNPVALNDMLAQFGGNIVGFGHFDLFRRVYDAFALLQKIGISAKPLIHATTNEPTVDTVRDLQGALRARYDAASWRDVVRPINDEMRRLQRDALVAYILHQMRSYPESEHIDTPEKLFEYFLMDVQMESCMQTSRVRHALSSVQLFIERCLMNLEPRVSPAAINPKQWLWMKRYRVWEANRKVYLFPENWLEPELRDDQSPFFKEAMSELLQGDITEERATIALLNYLSKLEEVAKLEPCGIYYVPRDDSQRTPEINHVVARTAGANRKYFYRRKEGGSWTPWEQIKLDIEDNPIIPVVWNDRLFLFWLRILKQGSDTAQLPFSAEGDPELTSLKTSNIKTDPPPVTVQAVLCWSEYYNGKWQPSRTSDVSNPLRIDKFKPNDFDRSTLKLAALPSCPPGGLGIILSFLPWDGTSFFLHNSFSTPERRDTKDSHFPPKRNPNTTTNTLDITYPEASFTHSSLVSNTISDSTIQPNHPYAGDAWDAPFFYDDARHVFYVTTSERLIWLPWWPDFGVSVAEPPVIIKPDLPPLVFEPEEIIPDPVGPIIKQPGFGVTDPSGVERYVTEDAYINRAIGTLGTIKYGDMEIGLAGSQIKFIRTR